MRDISNDTNMFYTTVLNFVQLLSEIIICVALVSYLLLQDTLITIGVAVSLAFMLIFFMGNYKKVLVSLGNQRRYYTYKMTQSMQQGFGGIKEIKISHKEDFFLQEFSDANKNNAEAERRNVFLNAVPKPLMESLCITGLMLVIAVKIALGVDSSAFIKTLAVFAVAAFRLLPSVNKISGYIGNILHNGVVIEEVYTKEKQIRQMEQEISQSVYETPIEFREKISVENLIFKYPETENNVLENVSLDIYKNQSVAFIGPTGAGKTTLVDLILGLLEPTEGRVLVDAHDVSESLYYWRELVGYIPQNIYMMDDTIRNNVLFGTVASEKDEETIWEALREAQLDEFVRTLPAGLDTMIGEAGVRLSGGQRQRIGIARALFRKPQVLVLDEATSALDNNTETAVMEAVEHLQGKLTIIIIAHRLTTIRNCDVVYEVCNKNVVRKEKEEVLA
jgi:ABC-type multidrug transport system fused ATPase/permease subunit